jgi:hypothetical protein
MHTKTAPLSALLFALLLSPLAAAHPGHPGHTHGEGLAASALGELAGSGHPKILLVAAILAAGLLIAVARGLLLERDHRHGLGRQTQD